MKKTVHVVTHTHWDREWYFSIEDSNMMLVEDMNRLIDVLEHNVAYQSFTFDAQYSVIEEYLKLCPEKENQICRLIQSGKLFIGPWYTQTDSLLVATESIIRNLLAGINGAGKKGGFLNNGYLPDIFGQNSYLPSIFKKFNINTSILQRGLYNDQLKGGLNFIWKSPNGDSVKANNLYFGYGAGKFLSSDPNYVKQTLLPILDSLASFQPSANHILLPSGGDQVLVNENLPDIINQLNQMDLPYHFKMSNYEAFFAEGWQGPVHNGEISGELLACENSRIHNTIRSHRVDIKLLNAQIEEKIYRQLEPLSVLSKELGGSYPQQWIEKCMKLLFDVQAHDSICGCNSDETNRVILSRLERIERIVDGQINILEKQITRGIRRQEHSIVTAFCLIPKKCTRDLTFTLFTKEPDIGLEESSGEIPEQTILNQQYISGGKQVRVTADGEQEIEVPGYYRTEILASVSFEGLGYKTLKCVSNTGISRMEQKQDQQISNEYYRIYLDHGALSVERKDKKKKSNLFYFENTADAGDSYDYSPLNEERFFSKDCEMLENHQSDFVSWIKVRHSLKSYSDLFEASSHGNTETIVIDTKLTIIKNSKKIKIEHFLVNTVKDHRIRVHFASKSKEETHYGEQGYSVLKRSNTNSYLKNWKELNFAECPQPVYPIENFVYVNEEKGCFGLYTKGLKEYEVTTDSLALTLFRSVGYLGKDDLAWRPGRASGINNKMVETPDAQMQGSLSFEYFITWPDHEFHISEAYDLLEEIQASHLTYHLQSLNTFEQRLERFDLPQPSGLKELADVYCMLEIGDRRLRVSALKKAEEGDQTVIRIFNPEEEALPIPQLFQQYQTVLLNETQQTLKSPVIGSKDFQTFII